MLAPLYPFSSLGSISSVFDLDLTQNPLKNPENRPIPHKNSISKNPPLLRLWSLSSSSISPHPKSTSHWSFIPFDRFDAAFTPTSILFLEPPQSSVESPSDYCVDVRLSHPRSPPSTRARLCSSLPVPHLALKYKKVADRVKPVPTTLPEDYRIVRHRHPDPLADLPELPHVPPRVITPTEKFTQERIDAFPISDELWPDEKLIVLHMVKLHENAFAWDENERGSFLEEFYPPILIPTVEHIPWALKNIPIPPALFEQVVAIVKAKFDAGVYEFSNSSYRSRWFCVLKKDKKSLRLVHDLQPLNAVSIRDPSVPMSPDSIAELFAGHARYTTLDLMVAFDQRKIDPRSRDLTTFQTPLGVFRLTSLPMGYTNSQQILHADVTYALSEEIPKYTIPYIDDVPGKTHPKSLRNADGSYITMPQNKGVRQEVYEHLVVMNRLIHRIEKIGGTFSAKKAFICLTQADILGHICNEQGRIPDDSRVAALCDWGPLHDVSEVRHFMGSAGVLRHFIEDFARISAPLNRLLTKDAEFEFGDTEQRAMDELKERIRTCPALRTIDYQCGRRIIFAVDSSNVGFGAVLYQMGEDNVRYPIRFFSRTWDATQQNYSQAKCELFGVFRALHDAKRYLIGVDEFTLEVDASYIKGMINNPDLQPSATINRWIAGILLFTFTLVHVPAHKHTGPDGLSRRPPQPNDPPRTTAHEDFIDAQFSLSLVAVQTRRRQLQNPTETQPHAPPHISDSDELPVIPPPQAEEQVPSTAPKGRVTYDNVPRSAASSAFDEQLPHIQEYLKTGDKPSLPPSDIPAFVARASYFFVHDNRLWRKTISTGAPVLVLSKDQRLPLLKQLHDQLGHKGFRTIVSHIEKRFWWPGLRSDISWYLKTCHECQIRQFTHIRLPPTVAPPATLFSRLYLDVMHLPKSKGCQYLVQARCSLTGYPEYRALRADRSQAMAEFIFEDIYCRWGAVFEIVHDNGPSFSGEFAACLDRFKMNPIRISPYNSRANLVERRHRDVREALMRMDDIKDPRKDPSRWVQNAPFVFLAERITVQRSTGYSPYYLVHGVDPLLPFDITEHTFMFPALVGAVSTAQLLQYRARALQRRASDLERVHHLVYQSRLRSAEAFVRLYENTVKDFVCQPGDLVLARNTRIEMEASRKSKPRYLGPFMVVRRTQGGSYILSELNGAILAQRFARFRIIPYHARIPHYSSPEDVTKQSSSRLDRLAQRHEAEERNTTRQTKT